MNYQHVAARLRHVATLIGSIADELDPIVTQLKQDEPKPKRAKIVQSRLPPCDIPGLADECWAAFVAKRINRTVALKLAERSDQNVQRRVLALTFDIAARRVAALQALVDRG